MEGIWVWILGGPRRSARDSWRLLRPPVIPGPVCSAFCHPAHPLSVVLPYASISVCLSVCFCLTPSVLFASFSAALPQTESKHCRLYGDIFISDSWWVVFWKKLHCWPLLSAVILAVAEGYDTFNIVFMAIGDSQASECFSMSSTRWLTTPVQQKHSDYNGSLYLCQHCLIFVSRTKAVDSIEVAVFFSPFINGPVYGLGSWFDLWKQWFILEYATQSLGT